MRRSVVVVCVALIGLVACGSGDSDDDGATTATTTRQTTRIAAFITKVDATQGKLTYDEVDFLTGDAAKQAYVRDNPGGEDDAPNDYYISNPAKTLKTIAIAPNAQVELNILAPENPSSQNQGASVVDLANAFDRSESAATRPFWLTLTDDAVVKIEEQYTP